MIISASRRTDIPAFYSDWFMKRIRAGFFYRINPFNSRQVSAFSLNPENVDAICFWTKNPRPLMSHLDELDGRGLHYYFHFTLNPYDRLFEPLVPPIEERIAVFRELADCVGPQRVIWRYDPVILSSATPVSWHLEQAALLAGQLQESTRRMVFSFHDTYGKGEGRLGRSLRGSGITLADITAAAHASELAELAHGFRAIADRCKLELFSCCEEIDLSAAGIAHGACIDAALIRVLCGRSVASPRDKNQRQGCFCAESVDMGMYDSCAFHCSYCYANRSERSIAANLRKHDPDSPALLGCYEEGIEIRGSLHGKN